MIEPENMSILIVDDMESMRKSIRGMMKLLGFGKKILLAPNGREGWKILKENHIDLAIIDWNMPVMKGIELLNRIRETKGLRDLPVIMITAEAQKAIVAEAAESDIDGYLLKPLTPQSLDEKIKNVIHLANNPSKATLNMQKARKLEEEGRLDESIEAVKVAIGERSNSSRYFRKLGQLYLKKENNEIAEKCFIKASAINANDAITRYILSELYLKKNDLINAVKYYDQAISISPRNINAGVDLGAMLISQGMKTEAMEIFKKVIGYSGQSLVQCEKIAELCIQNGDYQYAKELLESLIADNPERFDLILKAAILYEKTGETEKAIAYLKLVDDKTDDLDAKLLLAKIYIRMNRVFVADEFLNSILKINPKHKEALELRKIV